MNVLINSTVLIHATFQGLRYEEIKCIRNSIWFKNNEF